MYDDLATLAVTVNFPAQKVRGQVMMLTEEYKPLVEEALDEARQEIIQSEDVKAEIKAAIKKSIKDAVRESMEMAVKRVTQTIMDLKYREFKELAADILHEKEAWE